MKHHYNKEELIELKIKYDMQVSKEAIEEIKHTIDLEKEIERLTERYNNLKEEHIDTITRNEDYRARLDKAIEYIKTVGVLPKQLDSFVLLEILKGSDKE